MDIIALLGISVGLAMDAFAVSISMARPSDGQACGMR